MSSERRKKSDVETAPDERRVGSRRSVPRMPVSLWAVEEDTDGQGIYYHHVSDLSSGGLFLEKGLQLPVGSRMQLELTLPTARSIRAEGIVVTQRGNAKAGNGIRFDKISESDRAAIDDWIARK